MLNLGQMNSLTVHHLDEQGAWLTAARERILLPRKELQSAIGPGEHLQVFVYLGSSGQPLATFRRPRAMVGDFACLKVSQLTPHGAFLDWGLEKELLVPFAEQPEAMREGQRYLVKVCLDSIGRVVATGRIDRCLETEAPAMRQGAPVDLILWQFTDLGAKVIVNELYGGLLYRDELRPGMRPGDRLAGFIKAIRDDSKIDVTLRQSGSAGIEAAKATILARLQADGFLPLHDQSPAETIDLTLEMSKKLFKKAIGGLYKSELIELTPAGIRLKNPPPG